jgi:hypothetical protein
VIGKEKKLEPFTMVSCCDDASQRDEQLVGPDGNGFALKEILQECEEDEDEDLNTHDAQERKDALIMASAFHEMDLMNLTDKEETDDESEYEDLEDLESRHESCKRL